MFEAFDKQLERDGKRLGLEIFDRPNINNLSDIKSIIKKVFEANITGASVDISTDMEVDSRSVPVKVSVRPKTMYDYIIHGFTILNNRRSIPAPPAVTVNGREMRPACLVNTSMPWLDDILLRVLSAYRNGSMICWNISDGYEYGYDPLTKVLGRSKT